MNEHYQRVEVGEKSILNFLKALFFNAEEQILTLESCIITESCCLLAECYVSFQQRKKDGLITFPDLDGF